MRWTPFGPDALIYGLLPTLDGRTLSPAGGCAAQSIYGMRKLIAAVWYRSRSASSV